VVLPGPIHHWSLLFFMTYLAPFHSGLLVISAAVESMGLSFYGPGFTQHKGGKFSYVSRGGVAVPVLVREDLVEMMFPRYSLTHVKRFTDVGLQSIGGTWMRWMFHRDSVLWSPDKALLVSMCSVVTYQAHPWAPVRVRYPLYPRSFEFQVSSVGLGECFESFGKFFPPDDEPEVFVLVPGSQELKCVDDISKIPLNGQPLCQFVTAQNVTLAVMRMPSVYAAKLINKSFDETDHDYDYNYQAELWYPPIHLGEDDAKTFAVVPCYYGSR